MTKKQMRQWLIAGNGRAIVWVKEHGDAGYEDVIVQTCLYNRIADFQCNDGYDWYNAELFAAAGRTDYYAQRLLDAYFGVRDTRYRERLASVIGELAFRESEACREFVAANWRRELERHQTELAEQHIRLKKEEGYEEVLEFVGTTRIRSLVSENLLWGIHHRAEDTFGEKQTKATQARWTAKFVKLNKTIWAPPEKKTRPVKPEAQIEGLTISEMRSLAQEYRKIPLSILFRRATAECLEKVVQILNLELETEEAQKWLYVFKYHSFPAGVDTILRYVDTDVTRFCATEGLGKTRHPRVRQKGLEFCEHPDTRSEGITMLRANFEKGDEALLVRILDQDQARYNYHSVCLDILLLIEANLGAKLIPVALFEAERVPCGLCRRSLYKLVAKYRMLKRKDYEAMLYDSEEWTRKWAKKRLRALGNVAGTNHPSTTPECS